MTARERLALQAWRAGYRASTVALVSNLTARAEPDLLDDDQVEQVTSAIEVCAQASLDHDAIVAVARHNHAAATGSEDWRVRFWSRVLATARRRFSAPGDYGLSPCDRPTPPPCRLPEDLARLATPVAAVSKGGATCR